MKRNGSLRDVGFYLLIAVVLLMTIFALRGGMGNQEKVTYAQVRQLLEQQMVDQVVLEEHIKYCVRDGIEHGDADQTDLEAQAR